MSNDRTFISLTPQRAADLIMRARRRAIYAAPSLSLEVAAALVNAHQSLGREAVTVVLDVSEQVFRLGYGLVEAVADLRTKGVAIRGAEGLRIAFLIADDEGYIFTQPPLLVEAARPGNAFPNAIRACSDQIARLVEAVLPYSVPHSPLLDAPCGRTGNPLNVHAEIGQVPVPPTKIKVVEEAIKQNPPENFDLARVVQVFSAHIQFYEFEVRGTQLQNQTVQLPRSLLSSIGDKTTRDRITAAFKLVGSDSKVSGTAIREKAAEIRKTFIRSHPTYGGVILKTNRKALESEIKALEAMIENHKGVVRTRFDQDAKKSIEELVKVFWRDVAKNVPDDLQYQLGTTKSSMEEAKFYLRHTLSEAFPKAEKVAEGMHIMRVVKDVTWATLNDGDFISWLEQQFPLRKDLQQPFELYRAAKEAGAGACPR